ncbi:nucleoside hydrolase [Gryllotalpicola protaetiae]|uniref:Nucleoside hydrolase n=1 Tax=Gryllotalpicola protaetiae TaxID=2419771 RepID=A0A387BKJ1_9MICO|nr:nucleoside hydrolase [Gryllotalpicola protaetiae]AYG02684.1 nucleoside hydrolase [Gryllotalpicola protaetiae]
MPRKIILDCDPGHDDAVAMLLAQAHPAIDLLAVTTVAGNQSLPKVTRNALGVATLVGITAPIAAGAEGPLERSAEYAPDIHGDSGLDGVVLPEASVALDPRNAVDLIIELVMSHEQGDITLVPTGPLTNVALAVKREPRIIERVREVVLMGGSARSGNLTPVAEFNIAFDPEAADVVFSAGWRVVTAGLDVTHQALATPAVTERVAAVGGAKAEFMLDLIAEYGRRYADVQGFDAPPVHDPVAVAIVIDEEQGGGHVDVVRAPIAIETAGKHTTGMTVVDLRPWVVGEGRTSVALGLDADWFWDLVVAALR